MIKPTGRIYIVGTGSVNTFGTKRTSFDVRTGRFTSAVPKLARLQGLVEGKNGKLYAKQEIVHGRLRPTSEEARLTPLSDQDIVQRYRHYIDRNIGIRVIKPQDTETNFDPQRFTRMVPTVLSAPTTINGRVYGAGETVHLPRVDHLDAIHAATLPSGWDLVEEGGFKAPQYSEMQRVHLQMMRALADALIDMGIPWSAVEEATTSDQRTVDAANGLAPGKAIEDGMTYGLLGLPMPKWVVAKYIANTMAFYLGKTLGAETSGSRIDACDTGLANLENLFKRMVANQMLFGAMATFESAITVSSVEGFLSQKALASNRSVGLLKDHPSLISRPARADRSGFVLGEGGGVILLADEALADALGMIKYARLLSVETAMGPRGSAVNPDPAAPTEGVITAMRKAARSAARALDIPMEELGRRLMAIKGHGTSTPEGDWNAVEAYEKVLEEDLKRDPSDPVFVLYSKGGSRIEGVESAREVGGTGEGHNLGGASSRAGVEAVQIVSEGIIPPSHASLSEIDPKFLRARRITYPTQPLQIDLRSLGFRPVLKWDSQAFGDGNGDGWLEGVVDEDNPGREDARAWRDEQLAKIEGGLAKPADYIPAMSDKG